MRRDVRTRADIFNFLQGTLGRFLAGVAAAALILAAQTSDWRQRDPSLESLRASSSMPAALQSVLSHQLTDARARARSTTGLGPALPASLEGTPTLDAAHSVALSASQLLRPSVARRGYDATAPPR
jgi:hypothetical protein